MTTAYTCWYYPDGSHGQMFTAEVPTSDSSISGMMGQLIGGGVLPSPTQVANSLAAAHANDTNVSGAGLWAAYGEGAPTTYWLYKANP